MLESLTIDFSKINEICVKESILHSMLSIIVDYYVLLNQRVNVLVEKYKRCDYEIKYTNKKKLKSKIENFRNSIFHLNIIGSDIRFKDVIQSFIQSNEIQGIKNSYFKVKKSQTMSSLFAKSISKNHKNNQISKFHQSEEKSEFEILKSVSQQNAILLKKVSFV
mgnify:CR=1 FL=1